MPGASGRPGRVPPAAVGGAHGDPVGGRPHVGPGRPGAELVSCLEQLLWGGFIASVINTRSKKRLRVLDHEGDLGRGVP